MKAGDFFPKRVDGILIVWITFFDKALGRNGKENRFLTDIGYCGG